MNMQPIIIVGTGRCGSTMLSNALFRYEPILVLSEFFSTLSSKAFVKTNLNGMEFCSILADLRPIFKHLFQHKINIEEYANVENEFVPPMLVNTLPALTKEASTLYQEMIKYFSELPKMSISDLYMNLFDWLRRYFNKNIWIERSGSSLEYVDSLVELFPNARFIHIYRNGLDCAVSMSKHYGFKAAMLQSIVEELTGKNPFTDVLTEEEKEKIGGYANIIPHEHFNSDIFMNYKIPLYKYGLLWTTQVLKTIKLFKNFSEEKFMSVCYEDILNNPQKELNKVMKFINSDFEDDKLIEEMSLGVNSNKKFNWEQNLTEEEKVQLINSCKLGMRALGYAKRRG